MNLTFNDYFMGLISHKDQSNIMQNILTMEKVNEEAYKKISENEPEKSLLLTESRPKNKSKHILSIMKPQLAKIIREDFLNRSNKNWFKDFYSKNTYYKYRKQAVEEFLYHFFNT
ncbi:hypothetical protein NPA07_04445 [Mycoplasmopsis caviae]|uniref:Uncharacterized protein n=1 Tax=Mycoplasmopsis caviae TaxID=55603 RepID=A0A3P8L7E8_9BACT|nr:hypothetical protein [Mycoplasmopsis caviae]UUD35028.1 hypothetical protein NPA07_04445 [Mycoplasmopsis caviae]VDR42145.1 Uncharacterised protein [Mycoplasmopsis caviae]